MIKGLLIGFGFLIVMALIAFGIVRYANKLRNAGSHAPRDSDGPPGSNEL